MSPADTPVWIRRDVLDARRARALLVRCRRIEREYGDRLTEDALRMVRHVAFSAWLQCREAGLPVDAEGQPALRVRS